MKRKSACNPITKLRRKNWLHYTVHCTVLYVLTLYGSWDYNVRNKQRSSERLTPGFGADAERSFRSNEDILISDVGRVDLLSVGLVIAGNERLHQTIAFNEVRPRRYLWTEVNLHKVVAVDNKLNKMRACNFRLRTTRSHNHSRPVRFYI